MMIWILILIAVAILMLVARSIYTMEYNCCNYVRNIKYAIFVIESDSLIFVGEEDSWDEALNAIPDSINKYVIVPFVQGYM